MDLNYGNWNDTALFLNFLNIALTLISLLFTRGRTARTVCRNASSGPTLVNGFESRGRDAVVGLQMQPHLVAHAHDEVGDAGAGESAQEGNVTALLKALVIATFTCKGPGSGGCPAT